MKRTLTEVELDSPCHLLLPSMPSHGAAFTVQLPEGASVAVPAGFDPDEVFILLTVVREALR